MKSYTDLEQSKKLAEILPIESADMWYWKSPTTGFVPEHPMFHKSEHLLNIPAWSLSALLWYLKTLKPLVYLPMLFANDEIWILQFVERGHGNVAEITSDNPIDACYEIIIKLKEKGLL